MPYGYVRNTDLINFITFSFFSAQYSSDKHKDIHEEREGGGNETVNATKPSSGISNHSFHITHSTMLIIAQHRGLHQVVR